MFDRKAMLQTFERHGRLETMTKEVSALTRSEEDGRVLILWAANWALGTEVTHRDAKEQPSKGTSR